MKIHKEMVWNKGENPKKDGDYVLATFWTDGSILNVCVAGYTNDYGWNTSHTIKDEYGWGQTPRDGAYMWAELPF